MVGELLRLSHPGQTQYLPSTGQWADAAGKQTMGANVFRAIGQSLGRPGLMALKRLLGIRTQAILEDTFTNLGSLDTGTIAVCLYVLG